MCELKAHYANIKNPGQLLSLHNTHLLNNVIA